MSNRWDIGVYNRDNQLVLVVEVKNRLNSSSEWAARLRRNILAHGTFPNAPYFLLALPDKFYLWANNSIEADMKEADYVIDARPLLQPYFQQMGVTEEDVSSPSLEFIISSWLGKIINFHQPDAYREELPEWLVMSGLHQAVVEGNLSNQVMV